MTARPGVIAIVGAGRSGSTLLDNILGQEPGVVSVGELRFLWERGLLERRMCGSGQHLEDCELWRPVLERVYPNLDEAEAERLAALLTPTRTRYAPSMVVPWLRRRHHERLQPLVDQLDAVIAAVADQTGAGLVVDSSKYPTYAYALTRTKEADLRLVVHLVRDPRAVAYSWMRYKRQLDTDEVRAMTQHRPSVSSAYWDVWNWISRAVFGRDRHAPYLMLRYEDLIADPSRWVREILTMAGVENPTMGYLVGATATLAPNHTVSGNPSRFTTGPVELHEDARWKVEMPAGARRTVSVLTAPWLRRYGYPLRPG